MKASRSAIAALTVVIAVSSWAFVGARQAGQLPLEPLGNKGEALFPYLEGWYTNPDGTVSFLLGYMNRNTKQSFEIPVGPNNRIEPGNVDQGQPTVFNTGRNNRMFTITVPKDFGVNRKITWTLVANRITQSVSFWQNPPYFVEPFIATGTGNTPPVIKIDGGPDLSGPPRGVAKTYTAAVGQPLTLTVWAADKGNTIVLDPNPPQRGAGGGGGGGRGARGGAAADLEPPAPRRMLDAAGLRRMLDAAGLRRMLDAAGLRRMLDAAGLRRMRDVAALRDVAGGVPRLLPVLRQ